MGLQKISAKELKHKFLDQFPTLGFQGVRSESFWMPTLESLKEALELTEVDRQIFLPDVRDCDFFSLALNFRIKELIAAKAEHGEIPRDEWMPWAFGEAFCIKTKGQQGSHSLNVCMTTRGIYLIEPQTDQIWQPDKDDDLVLLIWM